MNVMLPGAFWRESEFVRLPGGTWLTGACGPNALAMGWSWSEQRHHGVLQVYCEMRARDLCTPNGISRMENLRTAAAALGISFADYRPYQEPWPDWHAWFLAQLERGCAILYLTAEAWQLVDAISGKHENANVNPVDPNHLRYHFLLLVGYSTSGRHGAGWWACDGCNKAGGNVRLRRFRARNVLQFYPIDILAASAPCAALAIAPSPS
jgi:hypothetical protein